VFSVQLVGRRVKVKNCKFGPVPFEANKQHLKGGERGKIRVVELVWGDFTQLGQVVNKAALSLVVAADVVYDEDQFEPLIETIRGCYRGHSQPKAFFIVT